MRTALTVVSVLLALSLGVGAQEQKRGPLTPAKIQNRDTVEKLYGNPVSEVYRTSQNLTITASYASNGDLCQAHIQSGVGDGITDTQLNAALDELAPKDVRGEFKHGTFLDVTCLKLLKPENSTSNSSRKSAMELAEDPCAECSGVSDDYERVNITKYGNTNQYSSVWITFHGPECKALDKVHH
ncbi:MAG TPA: hypothetical protein VK738_17685 [Terriglobales bacterium]|jgi:hypothetical protein|nr:hypothetical protein [Terriglobales bacterium]